MNLINNTGYMKVIDGTMILKDYIHRISHRNVIIVLIS